MGEKFYLKFTIDGETETFQIQEPFGFDASLFKMKQADERFARDITFSDGKIDLEFGDRANHQLGKILYCFDREGFEMNVSLIVEGDGETLELELDANQGDTDEVTNFKCGLIQDAKLQILKRRDEINVDLLSNKNLDGEIIDPLIPKKILIKALPLRATSKWESATVFTVESKATYTFTTETLTPLWSSLLFYINGFAQVPVQTDINDTVSNLLNYVIAQTSSYLPNPNSYTLLASEIAIGEEGVVFIDAKNNNKNLNIKIYELGLTVTNQIIEAPIPFGFSGGSAAGSSAVMRLVYKIGQTIDKTTQKGIIASHTFGDTETSYTFPTEINFTIPNLARTERLYIYWETRINGKFVPTDSGHTDFFGYDFYKVRKAWTSGKMDISATETSYNVVCPAFRIIDVMKQVVLSIAGLDVLAPYFEEGGYAYNQFIFSDNFLRLVTDKPFYITLKQVRECLREFNADCEVQPDSKVFFGLFPDFYTNEEVGFYPRQQFKAFRKSMNPRYARLEFSLKYKRYRSEREQTTENTADGIHGEAKWLYANKKTENTAEIEIEWERDMAGIEGAKRDAIDKTNSVSSSTDDNLYGIDVNVDTLTAAGAYIKYTETDFIQHIWDSDSGILTLKNTGDFDWSQLGITAGVPFEIIAPQPNYGTYTVQSLSANTIKLTPVGTITASSSHDGARSTTFKYYIDTTTIEGVSWTNEGFTSISGFLDNGQDYGNLRFSNTRNARNYHDQQNATANLYHKDKPMTNTYYKNNPAASTTYNGLTITEGEEFIPKDPILTPVLYENVIILMSFAEFILLQNRIRTIRGFIRFIDTRGFVRKLYVQEMSYSNQKEELTIDKGEEKYEPVIISITSNAGGSIDINNGEYTVSRLKYSFTNESVLIKDNEGQLLYNAIYWHRISVNGAIADNFNELKVWLQLL